MKTIIPLCFCACILFACNNQKENPVEVAKEETISFFPVTEYLKGEVYNIKQSGINPLKYTTVNGKTDSLWIKLEEIDSTVSEFLHPSIDSVSLAALYTGKNFFDQSLSAVTFTYDAVKNLPDTMPLKHWDVYINPKTNKVKRIYMVKEPVKNKILQLTWVNGEWCKITTIVTDTAGNMNIEKEEKLIWHF